MKKSTSSLLAVSLLALGLGGIALADVMKGTASPANSDTVRFEFQNNVYLVDGTPADISLKSNYHMKEGGHCWKSHYKTLPGLDTLDVAGHPEVSPDIEHCQGQNDYIELELNGKDIDKFTKKIVRIDTSHIPMGIYCTYNLTAAYNCKTDMYTPKVQVNHTACLK